MADTARAACPRTASRPWTSWIGVAAAAWSAAYAALGFYWSAGGPGFPFGSAADPEAGVSILAGVSRAAGAPTIGILGLAGAAVAVLMLRRHQDPRTASFLELFGWTAAIVLAVVIPDYRILVITAYAPVFLAGAPFGWPSGVSLLDELTWPVVNQALFIVGGLAWAGATIAFRRRVHGACARCGRTAVDDDWGAPARAARWGRWAATVAIAVPLFYASTRLAWLVGIPLGISESTLRAGNADGAWVAGAALASVAIGGALLTLGLVMRWGERFPAFLPFLGNRRVPIALAIVPASVVSVIVTSAGLTLVRMVTADTTGSYPLAEWGALGPGLLWPVWGAALAAATLAYYFRRRGPCVACGRGNG